MYKRKRLIDYHINRHQIIIRKMIKKAILAGKKGCHVKQDEGADQFKMWKQFVLAEGLWMVYVEKKRIVLTVEHPGMLNSSSTFSIHVVWTTEEAKKLAKEDREAIIFPEITDSKRDSSGPSNTAEECK